MPEVEWFKCGFWKILKNFLILNQKNFLISTTLRHDLLTLNMSIQHDDLKIRHSDIIDSCFFNKNWKYSFIVASHSKTYFVRKYSDSTHKYSEVDIKAMLEFLIDNIFGFGESGLPTICWNSQGHKLCWPAFIFLWSRIRYKTSTGDEISSRYI